MTNARLVDELAATGVLTDGWREAFLAVPRQNFIPDVALRSHEGRQMRIDRTSDPDAWQAAVNSDQIIITQMDDGTVEPGEVGLSPTSSCSMPSVVAEMLAHCDIDDGHRVLEIGTGTGWNAALLAHRLGDNQVVSVEIDPQVAERARKAFAGVAVSPQLVVGDGDQGWPAGAPYDRVLATYTVFHMPYPWVAQTRHGGLVVTPYRSPFSHQGMLLKLTVGEHGTASGRFVDWASFMRSRSQRPPLEEVPAEGGNRTATELHPGYPLDGDDAETAVGAVVSAQWWREELDNGQFEIRLDDLTSDSWAVVGPLDDDSRPTYPLRQGGPRRLWDEVEAAYRWWEQAGSPEFTRFGIIVTPDRQWVWLDEPANEVPARRA